MAFRDDRDALLARMKALEVELGEANAKSADAPALREELARLGTELRAQIGELDEDRRKMKELEGALEKVHAKLAPPAVRRAPVPAAGESAPGPGNDAAPPPPRSDFAKFMIVVAVVVGGLLFVVLVASVSKSKRSGSSAVVGRSAAGIDIPGFPGAVDAMALLETLQAQAGAGYAFSELEARYVGEDGLMSFGQAAYDATLTVSFVKEHARTPEPERPTPPPGVPAPPKQPPMFDEVSFVVNRAGLTRSRDSIAFDTRPAPKPTCSLAQLWRAARGHRVGPSIPDGALAVIRYPTTEWRYGASDAAPSYSFDIETTSIRLRMRDCMEAEGP